MKRNNFDIIRTLLSFPNAGDFYMLQILQRRKDNPGLKGDTVVIDNFLIYSFDMYDSLIERIIERCESNNARAYFRINRRNDKKLAQYTINAISTMIANNQHPKMEALLEYHKDFPMRSVNNIALSDINSNQKSYIKNISEEAIGLLISALSFDQSTLRKEFMSVAGKYNSDNDKKWIIDLDKEILEYEEFLLDLIKRLHTEITDKESKIHCVINTVSGKHIICNPFNVSKFAKEVSVKGIYEENLVQKDSPTLLYF